MIDKSLSQYQQDKKKKKKKKPNQLVSKRKDGKRPGYYGPDEGHYNDPSPSPSPSSPSGNGSEPYTPTRSVKEQEWATGSYTPPSPEPDTSRDSTAAPTTQTMKEEEWATGSYTSPTTTTETSDGGSTAPKGRNWLGDYDPYNKTGCKEKGLHMDYDGDISYTTDDTEDDEKAISYVIPKTKPKVLGVDKFGNPIIQKTTPYIIPDTDTDTTPWYKPTTEKLIDTGKTKAKDWAKRQLISAGLKKVGLGFINPLLGISSLIAGLTKGKIDPVGYVTGKVTDKFSTVGKDSKFAKGPTKSRGPDKDREYGNNEETLATLVGSKGDVVSKAINQFAGTKVETQLASLVKNDLNKALHYYAQMTPNIEAGKASQQEMDAYDLLGKYLVQAAPTKPDNRNYI